jgi:hypothetical protein
MTSRSTLTPERSRARLGRGLASAFLLGALLPGTAHAEVPLELTWEAPSGCPQANDVRSRIRAIAGDAASGMSPLRAEGRVVRVNSGYQLTLRVYEGGAGHDRTIDSASCADLSGAAAVSLALLLRSNRGGEPAADGGQPAPTSTDAARADGTDRASRDGAAGGAATDAGGSSRSETGQARRETGPSSKASTDRSTREPRGNRSWRALLRAPLLAAEVGRLSAPGVGLGAAVGLRNARWRYVADARIFQRRSIWSSEFPDVGVSASTAALALSGCRGFGRTSWELAPCLSVGVERWQLEGKGPNVVARQESGVSFVIGAGGAAHLYLSDWLAIVGAASLGLETHRPRVMLAGLGELRQLGPLRLDFTLGLEWIF